MSSNGVSLAFVEEILMNPYPLILDEAIWVLWNSQVTESVMLIVSI